MGDGAAGGIVTDSVTFMLPDAEGQYLRELVEQYLELVRSPDDARDPAIRRLSPDAYPDEAEASAEFRAWTRDDLAATRAADAERVIEVLRERERAAEPRPELMLDAPSQTAWLRTLAGLRIVLAARMGIVDDDSVVADGDPRYDVYEWLGYRQEMLLQSMAG